MLMKGKKKRRNEAVFVSVTHKHESLGAFYVPHFLCIQPPYYAADVENRIKHDQSEQKP